MKNKKVIILLIIVLILIFFVPSSFAVFKYMKNGNGTISGAEWDVSLNQTGIDNTLTVIPGMLNASYVVNVRSHSEVDVSYSIVVSSLPSNVEVSLDGGAYQTQTNNTITFSNVGTIGYRDETKEKTHILSFKAIDGVSYLSNQEVNVDVRFKQVV